jgi:hypothetical protein
MIPKQAIEKAIDGGWLYLGSEGKLLRRGDELRWQHDGFTERIEIAEVVLDPSFWQCLGKALGWGNYKVSSNPGGNVPRWNYEAKRFYDLILTKQSTEAFWADLLSSKVDITH